ncbi:MAG: CHAT domain-containing protein [Xenococcaceae cyanobacterium]
MLTLRLTQHSESQSDRYRVEIALEGNGPRQTATASFAFRLTAQDQENLRWYLEDYLQYPHDPAPQIAARVERRLAEIGIDLFRKIFQANDDARDLWATLRQYLADTRVEVQTGVAEASAIPWELLRDPKTDAPLALRAKAFVRAYSQAAQRPQVPSMGSGAIRILLVICRPDTRNDIPFRSVASRLIKGLADAEEFQLDVLRPPTFEQLSRVLRQAKAAGQPYHVVHFDGHGTYQEKSQVYKEANPLVFSDHRPGKHGYLIFENKAVKNNIELVNGTELGKLLVETEVPVLVLNACRSAHAEDPEAPTQVDEATADSTEADPHSKVRAFGSLAQEVMDAGVAGVVAMRYNVYVMTAAQFVADLYSTLTQGQPLGEAVTMGRKQLHAQPRREIAYQPIELQDWLVPIVYEAHSIALFPKPAQPSPPTLKISLDRPMPERGIFDSKFPPQPDVGFFGRDETLLALDRAFDSQSIVLLHAYAGSGKTATAAEFGRWYSLTGGVKGPVLFTSFEQYLPLPQVLNQLGQIFEQMLQRFGVQWLALSNEQRHRVALQVMEQIPVLWIWDNVEPVAGFPTGTESQWSSQEQQELADFLRVAGQTKAKFLLTSRRTERDWLGELPAPIPVPSMPMQERVQLTRAVAKKYGHRLTEVKDWRPLLRFTQGNPMTITIVVSQALRDGLQSKEDIEAFVEKLQSGEAELNDEEEEDERRDKSLGASLSYGFKHGFTETERKQLAILYLFQGFVDVGIFQSMAIGGLGFGFKGIPELHGVQNREASISLLNRAAEVGLLTAYGNGCYSIHPALSWYFKRVFDSYYTDNSQDPNFDLSGARGEDQFFLFYVYQSSTSSTSQFIILTFVKAMANTGLYYFEQYNVGDHRAFAILEIHEANLLYARRLAIKHRWLIAVIDIMQSLQPLYNRPGRYAAWEQLVEEILPYFVDLETDRALGESLGMQWNLLTDYRVRLAMVAGQWAKAERLQKLCLEWAWVKYSRTFWSLGIQDLEDLENLDISQFRQKSQQLYTPQNYLDWLGQTKNIFAGKIDVFRQLGIILENLAHIQRRTKQKDCVKTYQKALKLFKKIGYQPGAGSCAINLGDIYMSANFIPQDIDKAESWYQESLKLCDESDGESRAKSLARIANLAYERFRQAVADQQPEELLLKYANECFNNYQQALNLCPEYAMHIIAPIHNGLGNIYLVLGQLNESLSHYRKSLAYHERLDDLDGVALNRYNIAYAYGIFIKDFENALIYARAALEIYQNLGAIDEIQKTQNFIEAIEKLSSWPQPLGSTTSP